MSLQAKQLADLLFGGALPLQGVFDGLTHEFHHGGVLDAAGGEPVQKADGQMKGGGLGGFFGGRLRCNGGRRAWRDGGRTGHFRRQNGALQGRVGDRGGFHQRPFYANEAAAFSLTARLFAPATAASVYLGMVALWTLCATIAFHGCWCCR